MTLKISTAPHMNAKQTTRNIMLDVIIALIPTSAVGILFFGLNALLVILTSVAGCVVCEYLICRYLMKTNTTTGDLSAIITGLLLAFNLPSNIPLWIVLIGCFVAIAITKMAFGGLGRNLFNPALIGRVFLFISFPVQMTSWPLPNMRDFMNVDIQTGATTLGILNSKGEISLIPSYWDMLIGNIGGCIGEVSAVALLLGFAYLLYRKVIRWHIPVYYMGTVFIIMSCLYFFDKKLELDPVLHLLSGGLVLGAIFMATDYVTSPMSKRGQIIFAIGCGILTVLIRCFGSYPEGVSFAILIMNAFTPLIDRYTAPRVFGMGKRK